PAQFYPYGNDKPVFGVAGDWDHVFFIGRNNAAKTTGLKCAQVVLTPLKWPKKQTAQKSLHFAH
ncbi:MAG: hypothetical protein ACYTFW_13325, partial [Planctomycetota bacterium]